MKADFNKLVLAQAIILLVAGCSSQKQLVVTVPQKTTTQVAAPITIDVIHHDKRPYYYPTWTYQLELPSVPQMKPLTSKDYYNMAYDDLNDMLQGNATPNFELAVFISENAFYKNAINYNDYQTILNHHTKQIEKLIAANDKSATMNFRNLANFRDPGFDQSMLKYTEAERKELYRKALANWAIFTYITDTTSFSKAPHLPYSYQNEDPFGMTDWKNSQVISTLVSPNRKGNCFALAALFKIFANRLNSEAYICTAPNHIYIQHRDQKGDFYNLDLATKTFPSTGALQTLTYTYYEGIVSGISLRRLSKPQQDIALCVVNLGKSFEYKFQNKTDNFIPQCADLALTYDSLNLNALLLKEQVLEEKVVQYAIGNNLTDLSQVNNDSTFQAVENAIIHLYNLGYHQMPHYMQEIILATLERRSDKKIVVENRTPNPFTSINVPAKSRRYSTLSGGLYEEVHPKREFEEYGRFTINTRTKRIVKLNLDRNPDFLIDPVAFAMSVDPMAHERVEWSPYNAFRDNPILNIDPDGALDTEFKDADGNTTKTVDDGSNAVFQQAGTGANQHYEFKGYSDQGGKNEVNLTTAIQEQQNMNMSNPSLQQNSQGLGETHCNEATQNVMRVVKSAETDPNALVTGNANSMTNKMNTGTNPSYQSATQQEAEANAKNGGLSIVGYVNPNAGGHGHILTYSVGDNIAKGKVANIGPKEYTGFTSLNGSISKSKPKSFFIYVPPSK